MIPTKAYAVHNATGDLLRNNSVPVGPGATASGTARALQLSPNSLVKQFPELNVLINNVGIMKVDNALISSIVTTNLLGPIRMTSALIEHLKQRPAAYVIHVTSRTAFVPLAVTAAYSTTRAALHSFSLSQRYLLRDTSVRVLELAPLYVQTELMGPEQVADPRAMPLQGFIDETDAHGVLTERVAFLRNGAGPK